jgi:hypothetical protein
LKSNRILTAGTETHVRRSRRLPGGWVSVCSCGWDSGQDEPQGASKAADAWHAHVDERAASLGVQAEKLPRYDVARFQVTCGECGLRMQRGPYTGMPSMAMAVRVATEDGCPRCGGELQAGEPEMRPAG